ncbi:hypothetical protein ILUMI_27479 [Ignelater luminosus]|uniref:Mab-21-like HhH/H2TH-like domain-containing protein n=1 Tax=Ignelater luminosus TaxID=2038154 RepID=A0A8K0C6G4_IGNLU|nr:hypothetical protein ILUMI_27479 [Ignelater luminosus]
MKMVRRRTKSENVKKITSRELKDVEELVLPSSKLKFCSEQLQNLNYIFTKNLSQEADLEFTKAILLAKSVTERLIQRLLCGVGLLDSRFSTKFLAALHDSQINNASTCLEYLIRLDSLSKPTLYPTDQIPKYSIIENDVENCPAGYARIRLQHASYSRTWADFINSSGFLRRDKVQARLVELLAAAASGNTPNSPLTVDESFLCGSPGKIVDPLTLYNILQTPADQHIFYGAAGNTPRFPDPRDFKLAIVDEPSGIRLRVGFLSPALATITIEVRLLVAVGLDVWPSSTNFPFRVPLGHADCVLYHKAAQTGLYLTGYGVHSSAWQIRLPAAESVLENHYSQNSTITTIFKTLDNILQDITLEYGRHQISYKILNNYSLRTALFYELERDFSSPTETILNWSPKYLSTYVLKVLDNLVRYLRNQRQPNYFFPTANLLINPGHLCEDDFILEANKVQAYMLKLFDESLMSLRANEEFGRFVISQKTEVTLLHKWKDLVDSLMPPPSTRGRRICFAGSRYKREVVYTQYTTRQLEYIGIVLKNMLIVKQKVLQATEEFPWAANLKFPDNLQENPIEDIIYILVTLVEQARDKFLENLPDNPNTSKSKSKLKRQFDVSTTKLVELVRKEREVTSLELLDDTTLVKIILKWLYKGLDQNKKSLAPVLRPYLKILFTTSHGASWHLETIKQQEAYDEIGALGKFSKLVNSGSITPAQGLIDSISKNWNWAKDMLKVIEQGNLRLIFVPERGKIVKHILSLPPNDQKASKMDFNKSLETISNSSSNTEGLSLSRRHYLSTILSRSSSTAGNGGTNTNNAEDFKPQYCILRESSPMTLLFSNLHRRGEHRCCGDILQTLMAMQKVNVLQEVSTLLPNEERLEILEAIHKLTNERNNKRNVNKKKSNTFIQLSNSRRKITPEVFSEDLQKYTPKEESAGIRDTKQNVRDTNKEKGKEKFMSKRWNKEQSLNGDKNQEGTLIGSCRAARIRDDTNIIHFQDNFKIQSLMKHSSFKY